MTLEPSPVGTLTRTSTVHYFEQPCGKTEPHAQHQIGVFSGGGGSTVPGLIHGTRAIECGSSSETWCPGVHGLMAV